MADELDFQVAPGIEDPTVVAKYQDAGKIANRLPRASPALCRPATVTLVKVVEAAVAGAAILDLCKLGDDLITKETYAVYNKKVDGHIIPKGTCACRRPAP